MRIAKKRRLGITPKTALFCCGSERTLHGETAAEEIGVRPIPVWKRYCVLIEKRLGGAPPVQGYISLYGGQMVRGVHFER